LARYGTTSAQKKRENGKSKKGKRTIKKKKKYWRKVSVYLPQKLVGG